MKNSVPVLIRQIEDLNHQLRNVVKARQIKQLERAVLDLCDDLCAAYLIATPEERVDIHIALEYRDLVLPQFVEYFKTVAAQAEKVATKKRQQQHALQLIQQGVAANTLICRKVIESDIEAGNDKLIAAAERIEFDLFDLARELEVSYKYFIQRAIQYHKGRDRIRALKALGIALKLNPKLENNDHAIALAVTLTRETAQSAMITVSEGYVLKKLVQKLENEQMARQYDEKPRQRSAFGSIRSLFSSDPQ